MLASGGAATVLLVGSAHGSPAGTGFSFKSGVQLSGDSSARTAATVGPFVAYTLVLFNNTLIPGNYPAESGQNPVALAYDSGMGEIFVTNSNSNNVSVISDITDKVVATIPMASPGSAVTYDSGRGEIFVSNPILDNVTVIKDATNKVSATLAVNNTGQFGMVYDSGMGEVYVTNSNSRYIHVVADATNTIVKNIPTGALPEGLAYDAGKSEIFVSKFAGSAPDVPDNVSVIADVTNKILTNVSVGHSPEGLAYDSGKGEIFVVNKGPNTVSVISDATNTVLATINVGLDPQDVAYDSANGEVFVTNSGQNNVSVISDATNSVVATVPVGFSPLGVTYDAANGYIYVANSVGGSIAIISPNTGYAVTFTETGLHSGTSWSVVLNGITEETEQSALTFTEPNGTYSFTINAVAGFRANPSSGKLTVHGGTLSQPVDFGSTGAFAVSFTESGLPSGTNWSVTLSGTTLASLTGAINFTEPNGTYTFSIGSVSGYSSSPSSGTVYVAGVAVNQSVSFSGKPGLLGLPDHEGLYLIGGVVLLVIILIAVALLLRHRGRKVPPPNPQPTPPRS
jgi:YVTN family beta-propeller protein